MRFLTTGLCALALGLGILVAGCGGGSDTTSTASTATTESGVTIPTGQAAVDSCLADLNKNSDQLPADVQDKVKSLCESLGNADAQQIQDSALQICVTVATGVAPQISKQQATQACKQQNLFGSG